MTRFSINMDEALDFILKATEIGEGSDIFIPKMKAYSIMDIKNVLNELLGDTGEEIVGIRLGEKLHEVLINNDEIRYGWEIEDMYMISNPIFSDEIIKQKYPGIKKINSVVEYSSEKVERISKEDLKNQIKKLGLV